MSAIKSGRDPHVRHPTIDASKLYEQVPPEAIELAIKQVMESGGSSPLETATKIAKSIQIVNSKTISIYGNYSTNGKRVRYPKNAVPWNGYLQGEKTNYIHKSNDQIEITMDMDRSLYIEGVRDIRIHVTGKIKYLMLLDSVNAEIVSTDPPIAGVYFLRCHNVGAHTINGGNGKLGFAGVELTTNCHIHGNLAESFTFSAHNCRKIKINGEDVGIHEFISGTWRMSFNLQGIKMIAFALGRAGLITTNTPQLMVTN